MILLALLLQAAPCPNPDGLPPRVAEARCAGVGLARIEKWREAAELFEGAAKALNDAKAARLWAQAGNAWLAAGDAARAGAALDSALVWSAGLSAAEKGELQLDRARAAVAAGQLDAGRTVLDQALASAPEQPLSWLLSATLARRMGQPQRAATDIAEALKRAPEDAAVQLEAGNIAALAGNRVAARERWTEAARLQPDGDTGRAAKAALAQLD
jgi:hypothetical protein